MGIGDVQRAVQVESSRTDEPISEYIMNSDGEDDVQFAIQQSLGFECQNAQGGGNGVATQPGFGTQSCQTVQPFAHDEMREATQAEIEVATQLDAALNAQYALQDQDELIEQVPPHPHVFSSLHERCWGKPTRHQYRTMRRYLKFCL